MGVQRTSFSRYVFYILDFPAAVAALIMARLAWFIARGGGRLFRCQAVLKRAGLAIVRHHYYEPLLFESDLRVSLREKHCIEGLDLNEKAQVDLITTFHYREELLSLPLECSEPGKFCYHNGYFESGDAEFFYDIIRFFKPHRIVEIGSGNSALVARRAIKKTLQRILITHVTILASSPTRRHGLRRRARGLFARALSYVRCRFSRI